MSATARSAAPALRLELVTAAELAPANEPMVAAAVLEAIEHLRAEVAALAREVAKLRRSTAAPNTPRLVSFREAARRLGVSRTRTLPALIRDKAIRVVHVNGRARISTDEIERLCREGAASRFAAQRAKPQPRASRGAPLARSLVA